MKLRCLFCLLVQCIAIPGTPIPVGATESIARVEPVQKTLHHTDNKNGIHIYSIASLSNITVDGFKASELSGLAWNNDEEILYALSDNGFLIHLRPVFSGNQLTDIMLIAGYSLLDNTGNKISGKLSDSEGMTIINGNNGKKNDAELLISFERVPRIVRYTPDGIMLGLVNLSAPLNDIANYNGSNKSLESITQHINHGLLTGPEIALKNGMAGTLNIYAQNGDSWHLPASNREHGALVDMTTMPDGGILLLERAYLGFLPGIQTSLHKLKIENKNAAINTIITLHAGDPGFNENFEGITHFRGNDYFMVSDDNNHPLKQTLLVFFCILQTEY